MKSVWTSHIKSENAADQAVQIERFKQVVKNSKSTLDRQSQIIDDRLNVINSIETGVDIYTKPGWAAIQAHYNGEKAALHWIKKLINLDQEGTDDR
jgi:hypothetical protein